MPRFFCDEIINEIVNIDIDDSKHMIKVLRMSVGDQVTLCDARGYDYSCVIENIDEIVQVKVLSKYKNETEPTCEVVLYQALPKGEKMDFIIQKAVELGVTKIVPVQTKFCIAKIDSKSQEKKLARYNKIAKEAAKQCGRGIIPEVLNILDFDVAIKQMAESEVALMFYENATAKMQNLLSSKTAKVAFMIGSEGGFSDNEVDFAIQNNIQILSLGKRILRCETAPIVAATLIMNLTENM